MVLPRFVRPPVAWLSRTPFFRSVGPSIMPPLERVMDRVTGGRMQVSGLGVPTLVLHTIGAKSGLERDTVLMYCPDGREMLVVGSNFARDAHPAWTANLLAHPEVAVSLRGRRIDVHAAPLDDVERELTWPKLERNWPGYRKYEVTAGRTLRVFRLTPQ
ncbi:nitroreductase family deazaflavin-dependent oxidoreductase [Pseudolysinimonas sp.]|uniref:nitroreductase family deazaflavin-dependent oxidoreductase n=1 Tax=Pseudolysinimonas sp. TaxID=2680009 RepID=UPI00286CA048|nr:nitroreductase family deazaflavin-dependent oxidoreductase [Pseudolysinimonas sp.]